MIFTTQILLAAALTGAPLSHIAGVSAEPAVVVSATSEAGEAQDDALYAQGTKAMDEQRWADAVTAFDKAAAVKGKRLDASLYWKAYSLDKLGRKDEARATCEALRQAQSRSTWNRECTALRVRSSVDVVKLTELAQKNGVYTLKMSSELRSKFDQADGLQSYSMYSDRPASEDDIRILALNSLMRQDPAKAMPMLRDLLHSDKPVAVRREALFVLTRSKQPEAQALLTEIATGKADPDLQREAVQILAVNRGKEAGPTLVDIYRSSADAKVKRAAVNGLYLAHDAPRLVELARGEKDLNLKRDIVSQLALMKDQAATDYMMELLK